MVKNNVIGHRVSEKEGEIPRINLMIIQKGEKTHYSYVKRLTALLHNQTKNTNSTHFCERCLHGYTTKIYLKDTNPNANGC